MGISIHGQNVADLDVKNGFKNFTLGDPFSKWQSTTIFLETTSDSMMRYKYNGDCCTTVFTDSVTEIDLVFYRNKLAIIWIYCKPKIIEQSDSKISSFLSNFTFLYGEPTSANADQNNPEGKFQWIGQKVILYVKFVYIRFDVGYQPVVCVADKKTIDGIRKSGF
jgi:hypothetical protein